MIYIGVDPGANFSGIAVYDHGKFTEWFETAEPMEIINAIDKYRKRDQIKVVLEDFTGSGILNKARKRTIEIIGYVRNTCRYYGTPLVVVPNQRRLAYVIDVPSAIAGKDEKAAAAHVLAQLAREKKHVSHL